MQTQMPGNARNAKNIVIAVVAVLSVLLLIVAGCGLLLSTVFGGMCGNEIFQEAYSPDGEYKAVVFQRDCGATTGFSTQISILKASADLPDKGGNVFIIDGHPDWTGVTVDWETNRLISISYSDGYSVSEMEDTIRILFSTIEINYNPGSE